MYVRTYVRMYIHIYVYVYVYIHMSFFFPPTQLTSFFGVFQSDSMGCTTNNMGFGCVWKWGILPVPAIWVEHILDVRGSRIFRQSYLGIVRIRQRGTIQRHSPTTKCSHGSIMLVKQEETMPICSINRWYKPSTYGRLCWFTIALLTTLCKINHPYVDNIHAMITIH